MSHPKQLALLTAGLLLFSCHLLYTWRLHVLLKSCASCGHGLESTDLRRTEGEALNVTLEMPLPASFQAAMDTYPVVATADVKIVLVLAYYRSGSTFSGELLSSGNRSFFHFEPLQMFTRGGRLRLCRENEAFQLLDHIVRCRMAKVPLYTVWWENNPQFLHLNRFLADVCGGGESCFSPEHISSLCSRAKTQVLKFTRLSASQVAAWIQRNTDISHSIRVVHLVRDPRAIFASRQKLDWCRQKEVCQSAEALCGQMSSDLDGFGQLSKRMGPRRTYRLFFEQLAADPWNETQRLFSNLDLEFTPDVAVYLEDHTSPTVEDLKDRHSTRKKSKFVINRWKRQLSRRDIFDIEEKCGYLLRRLGYELLMPHATDIPHTLSETNRVDSEWSE